MAKHMLVAAHEAYESTCQEMKKRILAIIPKHPEVLKLDDAWELLRLVDFKDLQPSVAQAHAALAAAKAEYKFKPRVGAAPPYRSIDDE